ncbi:MAG: hypothetical protein KBS64_00480 [Treponema sp.]|nr:hypothetical protein [Candidatus Treponema equi]
MKKLAMLLSLSVFSVLFAQESNKVPELLKGVWKNQERYVVFDSGYGNEKGSIPMMVLRTFYQRYDDRVAEPNEYTKNNPRKINDATQKDMPEELSVRFVPLTYHLGDGMVVEQEDGDQVMADGIPSGAWNMQVVYPRRKEIYNVPFAVIGGNLYLNFIVKEEDSDKIPQSPLLDGNTMQSGNPLAGYWQDSGNASGILVSPPVNSKELLSFYITDSSVYHIRYWRTDMDYDGEKQAVFSDGDETYHVPKHLRVSGETFTCVNGRGSRIRNIEKSETLPKEYTLNSIVVKKTGRSDDGTEFSYSVRTSTICAMGQPYLTLENGKTLEQILKEDAAKKYPEPQPLFPAHGILDFDWSIIEDPPANWNMRMLDIGK